MKSNLILLSFIASSIIISACSTKQLTKTVHVKTTKTQFTPQLISHNLDGKLKLTLEPIDAKNINKEVFNSTNLDGSYSKEQSFSYYQYLTDNKNLSSYERKLKETIIKVFEGIDELYNKKEINLDQSNLFKEKVYTYYILDNLNYGFDGSEVDKVQDDFLGESNPYLSNGKYLSLYKLSFTNSDDQVKDVDIKDFQILSENELLYPFKIDYFEGIYSHPKDEQKLRTIYRINMPANIRLVKNQSVSKYFSTPAINLENKKLVINYIKDNNVKDYEFQVKIDEVLKEVKLDQFKIRLKNPMPLPHFYIYQYANNNLLLKGYDFFIDRDKQNQKAKLLALYVDRYKGKVNLTITEFSGSESPNKIIKINNK